MQLIARIAGNTVSPLYEGSRIVLAMDSPGSATIKLWHRAGDTEPQENDEIVIIQPGAAGSAGGGAIAGEAIAGEAIAGEQGSTEGGSETLWFTGRVVNIERDQRTPTGYYLTAECADHVWLMQFYWVNKALNNMSDRAMYQDLLATVGLDTTITASDSTVDIIESSLSLAFPDITIRDAFNRISEVTGGPWRLDGAAVLHHNTEANADAAPFNISDAPDGVTTFGCERLMCRKVFESPANRVTVIGGKDQNGVDLRATVDDATPPYLEERFRYTHITDSATLAKVANALLATRGVKIYPSFRTKRDGLDVNQKIEITSSVNGLTAEPYVIRKLTLEQLTPTLTSYEVECGPPPQDHDYFLRKIKQRETGEVEGAAAQLRGVKFLSGSTSDRISVPAAASIDNLGPLTVSCWISRDTDPGTPVVLTAIVQKLSTSTSGGWGLMYDVPTDTLQFVLSADTTALIKRSAAAVLPLSTLTHVLVTWDGVITDHSGVHIYVNGAEVSYGTSQNGSGASSDAAFDLEIGGPRSGQSLRGLFATVAGVGIWNKVLESSSIATLAGSLSKPNLIATEPSAQVAALMLNDFAAGDITTGATAVDSSSGGNNGTAQGSNMDSVELVVVA